ncbi:MAG: hypothetical protein M1820_000138 [Bogoriella megaspora]|nr:MAG: hypothetical protein M1820_000138 [Bogoriella megaspora]
MDITTNFANPTEDVTSNDDNVQTSSRLAKLSLDDIVPSFSACQADDSASTMNGGGIAGDQMRLRLAPKGPRLLASRTRDNYAKARLYKSEGIPKPAQSSYALNTCETLEQDTLMADVESEGRRGGGSGGFGRGGRMNNPRKRRNREDDNDHDDRRHQRRRYQEPFAQKVRRELLKAGDTFRTLEDEARKIADMVVENVFDREMVKSFHELVTLLIFEQPFKIPFLAAVIIYTNQREPEIAEEILARAGQKAQNCIEQGTWRELKLVLRFLACLQKICEGEGVFPILDTLFDRAADLQELSVDDAVGLELVKIILLTLPFLIKEQTPEFEQRIKGILEKTGIIADAPNAILPFVEPYPAPSQDEDAALGSPSIISLLQQQLQRASNGDWDAACIPSLVNKTVPWLQEGDDAPKKHTFPTINVPQTIYPGPRPLFPEVYCTLYDEQELETVPPKSNISSTLIRDVLVDTINSLDFNRTSAAKFITEADQYWDEGTFAPRGIAFNKLPEIKEEGKKTWKIEDMAIDAIFSQMLQLPTAEHKLVYYHSVITECCKHAPGAIAPSLGRAIRFMYRNIEFMDLELAYRFLDWFGHHLSNFEFRWKWTEWNDDVTDTNLHPRKAFIVGAIDKEIRLSFAKRIRETLPEVYHPLIPKEKENDTPKFKYASDQTPYAQEGREIHALLRKKAADTEFDGPLLAIARASMEQSPSSDPLLPVTDAFMTAICFLGSKSLSHALSCIDRCKDRLLGLGTGRLESSKPDTTTETGDNDVLEAQLQIVTGDGAAVKRQIIQSVVGYWRDHPGNAVSIVDKLLNYAIINPMSVIEWALMTGTNGLPDASAQRADGADTGNAGMGMGVGEAGGPREAGKAGSKLAEAWVYEMVASTVAKVTKNVRAIVAAKTSGTVSEEAMDQVDQGIHESRNDMRTLFAAIRDTTTGLATGAADGMIEQEGQVPVSDRDLELRKQWGKRWNRVFERKAVIEEGVVGEQAVEMAVEVARKAAEEARVRAEKEDEAKIAVLGTNGDAHDDAIANGDAAAVDDEI